MNVTLRRKKILDLLCAQGTVEVKALAKELNTSHVTVRNDLTSLEKEGKLERFFGGAALPTMMRMPAASQSGLDRELAVNQRYQINDEAKRKIAAKAAEMVASNSTIIIDSGSTTHLLAQALADSGNVTVITNNLAAASTLAGIGSVTLAISGGVYRNVSQSIHGHKAEEFFDGVYADIAFIGADGLDPEKGVTTFNEGYNVTQMMAKCAKTVVILADSSKLSRSGFNQVLLPEQLDMLITDTGISNDDMTHFRAQGIHVIAV
ncbi:DeoR/GlpR family DNA-binding transcription regulator [Vibrio maritimus]|nr:DeoR/GlpR family DNA-binding transcription regulator [Vibrio maritimus]